MALWSGHWQNDAKEQSFAYSQDMCRIAREREASLRSEPLELLLYPEILKQISNSLTETQGATQGEVRVLIYVMSISLSVSCSGGRGSFMLSEGCHSFLPWFSSASPLNGTYVWRSWSSLYLRVVLRPAHLPGPVLTSFSGRTKWEQSHTAPSLKSGKGQFHKALIFARDIWETTKGSCLLCSL